MPLTTENELTSLDHLRQRIDDADRQLLAALSQRMEVVDDIFREKESRGLPLFDAVRERDLLAKLVQEAGSKRLDSGLVERVLREVIQHSRHFQSRRAQQSRNPQLQPPRRVGFQGVPGAYSWTALHNHLGQDVESIGFSDFYPVMQALRTDSIDLAFLPIENTLAGSIHDVYELISEGGAYVVGEEVLRIDHCLGGLSEIPLEEIRRVLSHPVALQQCKSFLRSLPRADCQACIDTAESARLVKNLDDPACAAIASREAIERYGLRVLREGISDHSENHTRFWVVSRTPVEVDLRIPAKTSLLLVTDHREGALVECLTVLREQRVNMTKLESRPRKGHPWQYQFYLDLDGNLRSPGVDAALSQIRARARLLRVLGSYPTCSTNWDLRVSL